MELERMVLPVTEWFLRHQKALPWREKKDPYRIWVSEIMLQQTRIEAVIPYYRRFLRELPTLSDLATCPDEKLMKLWEGLGYYSRARNLKKAAVILTERCHGAFPEEAEELEKLPGIGAYTAGAIASIAFGKPSPAVDGNVLRVIARVFADESDISSPTVRKQTCEALRAVYPSGEASSLFTQGLMELGENICLPNGVPLCEKCPLCKLCLSTKNRLYDRIPFRSPKKKRTLCEKSVLLLSCGERFALQKRAEEGLLAGMWEFPCQDGKTDCTQWKRQLEKAGIPVLSAKPFGEGKHIFTHLEWHMRACRIRCKNESPAFVWKTIAEIESQLALPSAFRPFFERLKTEKD